MKNPNEDASLMAAKIWALEEELRQVKEENARLRERLGESETVRPAANDEYLALIQIMDRARKLAFLAEEPEEEKPRFKMGADGSLTRMD